MIVRPRTAAALALAAAAMLLAGCSASSTPQPRPSTTAQEPEQSAPAIRLLGPDEVVELTDDPIALVVEVAQAGRPVAGVEVTFLVVGGPGEYPGGFEVATTDDAGVATSTTLQAGEAGVIEVEVATDQAVQRVEVEVTG